MPEHNPTTKIQNIPTLTYILALWIIVTSFNLHKAFHIDDTFHLEAAEHLANHPLRPMSGLINWADSPTPMFTHNQPPLFFYLMAATQQIFGSSEIILHLLLSVFTLLALLYFYKLSLFLKVKNKTFLIAVFAFCPAFIVNQNVMTDIPILWLTLGIIYHLLKGIKEGHHKDFFYAAVLLSIGLLIKYSLLPIFLVLLLAILLTKNYKKLPFLLIPIMVLLLWSYWNNLEYGAAHILDRPKGDIHILKVYGFLASLGAISTFSVIYIYTLFPRQTTRYMILLLFSLLALSVPLVYFDTIKEQAFNQVLNYLFILNGSILILFILIEAFLKLKKEKANYFFSPHFTLAIYILGTASFIALFAPFNATRHAMLVVPFILLISADKFDLCKGIINNLVLVSTISLGVLLGISDWVYADFYRKNALNFETTAKKVWSVGHWGWQWYTKKAGMSIYSKQDDAQIRIGDLVLSPGDISRQKISPDIVLDTIDFITRPSTFWTFFSGNNFASMYNSSYSKPPWALSKSPIDTIYICSVIQERDIQDIMAQIKNDEGWFFKLRIKAIQHEILLDSMLATEAKLFLNQHRSHQ